MFGSTIELHESVLQSRMASAVESLPGGCAVGRLYAFIMEIIYCIRVSFA